MKKITVVCIVMALFYSRGVSYEISDEIVRSWVNEYVGFEKNMGQVTDFDENPVNEVLFKAKLPGYGIFITEKGVSYVIYRTKSLKLESQKSDLHSSESRLPNAELQYARIDLELMDADIDRNRIEYEDELPGYTNYYLPSCPDGILFVKSYRKIRIKEVYPGIDWVWKFENGQMHHEFEVKPYADITMIKMKVKWADVETGENAKSLTFKTPIGEIKDGEVYAYEKSKLKSQKSKVKSQSLL